MTCNWGQKANIIEPAFKDLCTISWAIKTNMYLFYLSTLISKLKSLSKFVLFKVHNNASFEVSDLFVCVCMCTYVCENMFTCSHVEARG